jgi:hypothetical protein
MVQVEGLVGLVGLEVEGAVAAAYTVVEVQVRG